MLMMAFCRPLKQPLDTMAFLNHMIGAEPLSTPAPALASGQGGHSALNDMEAKVQLLYSRNPTPCF